MRSGLPRHDLLFRPEADADELPRGIPFCRFSDDPSSTTIYTTGCFLRYLSNFSEYLMLNLCKISTPLGMKSATFGIPQTLKSGLAVQGFRKTSLDKPKLCDEIDAIGLGGLFAESLGNDGTVDWWIHGNGNALYGPGGASLSLRDVVGSYILRDELENFDNIPVAWMSELLPLKIIPANILDHIGIPTVAMRSEQTLPILSHDTYALGQWVKPIGDTL